MTKPAFNMVITSDRYDLLWEEQTLASLPDMAVELTTAQCEGEDDFIEATREADAILLTSRDAITPRVVSALDRCRVISRYAVGIDRIDLEAATRKGIVVTYVPDYCTAEVADHALALILALNRRIVELDRELRTGAWLRNAYHTTRILHGPVPPLREQTLGIIGIGRIGSQVARRAAPFGMRVLAADPYLTRGEIAERGAEPVDMQTLAREADIVSIHCPLTTETTGLIDRNWLALLKPAAVVVNTARGSVIELDDLVEALQQGRIAGAALDVVHPEPLPEHSPLYAMPNVILTPHSAYYSERSILRVREDALDGALRVLRGQFPRTVANPEVMALLDLAPYTAD
jgi:D-3-phosphoglycerate dehydrogenase